MPPPSHASARAPTFGDVRALMQHAPSADIWQTLVQMLDAWPGALPDEVVHYVRAHLFTWSPELKRAPLSWLQTYLDVGSAPPLLCACTSLQLGMRDRQLEPAQVTALASARGLFDSLHVLEAPYQWKSPTAMIEVLLAPWCAELRVLDLKGNPLGGEGLSQLTLIASQMPKLERLGLCNTALRAQSRHDPLALLHFLQSSLVQRLTHLDLSSNELGWGTGETLAMGLGTCTKLESLGLSRCDFISEDMPHLARILHDHTSLQHLDIAHNHLDEELLERFIMRARGASLQALALQGNGADLGTVNTLASCIGLEKLTLGEASRSRSEHDTIHAPYEGLEHLEIQGSIHQVWRALFEDVDALPDLTTLELLSAPTRYHVIEELLYFIEASSLTHLHLHALEATPEVCELCRSIEPHNLESLELSGLRGDEEDQEELLGIDWIAEALIS